MKLLKDSWLVFTRAVGTKPRAPISFTDSGINDIDVGDSAGYWVG